MENASLLKHLIRSNIKKTIKSLSTLEKKQAAENITNLIKDYLNLLNSDYNHVACYWPTQYEINTISLIDFLLTNNKFCYLPIIYNNNLNFIQYNHNTKLIKNKFGILEPEFNINQTTIIDNLDIIFMPLVAFDTMGNRIGSGKGMYDRALINKNNIKLIGLGYSIQQVPIFQPDPWDINLDIVFTEKEKFQI